MRSNNENRVGLSPRAKKLLRREAEAIIHFNDVFTERAVDFDAELTTSVRNIGRLSDKHYPIGADSNRAVIIS